LSLYGENPVSKFAFKCNLYRYAAVLCGGAGFAAGYMWKAGADGGSGRRRGRYDMFVSDAGDATVEMGVRRRVGDSR
jgi:hypothetical protein